MGILVVKMGNSMSINKSLVTEFVTVKVSQNLSKFDVIYCISKQRNQHLSRYMFSKLIECFEKSIRIPKSIVKDHQIPNKWIDCKILEVKYGNTKQLGNTEYNQEKLVLAASAFFAS